MFCTKEAWKKVMLVHLSKLQVVGSEFVREIEASHDVPVEANTWFLVM